MTTMNRRAILLVCAVLALLAVPAVPDAATPQKDPFKLEYLDWRDLPEEFEDKKEATRNVIRSIGIQDGDGAEDILKKMQAISDKLPDDSYEKAVCRELVFFSKHSRCWRSYAHFLLSKCALVHEDKSLANFAPFLIKYGGTNCVKCRQLLLDLFVLQPDSPMREGEASLGEFFAVLLGLEDPKLDDSSWMLEEVKKLDLLERDDLNVGLAVEYAKKLGKSKSRDSIGIFDGFLSAECSKLKNNLDHAISFFAMDIAFNDSAQLYDARVLKLLEFTRVCLSWRRKDMRAAAVENIKNQLETASEATSSAPDCPRILWKSWILRALRSKNADRTSPPYDRIN